MNIFVIGASGYIGRTIAAKFKEYGHSIVGLARSLTTAKRLEQAGIEPVNGNIKDLQILQKQTLVADAVIYAAVEFSEEGLEAEYQAVKALLDVLKGTAKTLIFTSGVGVLGNDSGIPMDEDSPYAPWELITRRVDTEKAIVNAVKSYNVNAFIIRPGMVYGGVEGGNGLGFYIKNTIRLEMAPYLDSKNGRWPVVHVDDLAELYYLAVSQGCAANTPILHAVTEEEVTLKQIANTVAKHFKLENGAKGVNFKQMIEALGPEGEIFAIDQHVLPSRAVDCLGWRPVQHGILQEIVLFNQ